MVGRLPCCEWVWTQTWDWLLASPPFPLMAAEAQRTPLSLCLTQWSKYLKQVPEASSRGVLQVPAALALALLARPVPPSPPAVSTPLTACLTLLGPQRQ